MMSVVVVGFVFCFDGGVVIGGGVDVVVGVFVVFVV